MEILKSAEFFIDTLFLFTYFDFSKIRNFYKIY